MVRRTPRVCTYMARLKERFDWSEIVKEARVRAREEEPREDGKREGFVFLGTVFAILPSGVYSSGDKRDEDYWEALEAVAEGYGGSITTAFGDPCDVLFSIVLEDE